MSKDDREPPLPSGPPAFRPAGEYGPVRTPPATRLEALQAQPVGEEALGDPADWQSKLDELHGWSGSAWIAGEDDDASDSERKSQCYSFLCSLIGYLMAGRDAAALTASPPVVERDDARAAEGKASWEVQYAREADGTLRTVQTGDIPFEECVDYEDRILAVEMRCERLKRLVRQPEEPGGYKGDSYYPVGGTEASHEWDGERWNWLPDFAQDKL